MGNGNAVASTGTITQGMGATAGGSTASAGVNMGGTASVPVNGSNVPVAVKTNVGSDVLIPAAISALSCARGGVAGAVICGGTALALPLAMDWLANAGMRINPATKELEKADPSKPQDGWWLVRSQISGPYAPTRGGACEAASPIYNSFVRGLGYKAGRLTWTFGDRCDAYTTNAAGVESDNGWQTLQKFSCPPGPSCDAPWLPASMDDIAPYMNKAPVDPGIVKELTDAGQNLGNPPLQVSGPSSVPGPTTTNITNNTTNNSTTTTTTNTTNNYTYNKNSVTNTGQTQTQTKTTTTTNADGTKTTTTDTGTTTTTPGEPAPPEEQKVQCDKYPNSLGCAEMDVPSGDIPKDTKNITYSEQSVLGGGSCPANRRIGNDYTFSYADTCSTIVSYVRPLVLMIAGWMAIVIIFSIGKPDA